MHDSLSGQLLIASPYLSDPNFMRSVVLIVNHDNEGAFGLSLTRPTDKRLGEVLELSMCVSTPREDDQIFEGGPVGGHLLALHTLSNVGVPVHDADSGIWITGDDDHIRMLLTRVDVRARFVANYSGWGPGQLEQEMEMGGWMTAAATDEIVFDAPDQIWETAVKRCGQDVLSMLSPGLRFDDPSVN